jgi:hypothetical protein
LKPQSAPVKHHIEHILPRKHGGESIEENLALSCPECNHYKGSNISGYDNETGNLVPLFNPRTQVWSEHFRLEDGVIIPLSPEGRVTAQILRFNDPERIEERQEQIDAEAIK